MALSLHEVGNIQPGCCSHWGQVRPEDPSVLGNDDETELFVAAQASLGPVVSEGAAGHPPAQLAPAAAALTRYRCCFLLRLHSDAAVSMSR